MFYKIIVALSLSCINLLASPLEISKELVAKRVSSCGPKESYAEVIDRLVESEINQDPYFDKVMGKFLGFKETNNTSLFSHLMCRVKASMFLKGKRRLISKHGIQRANDFVESYNKLVLSGDRNGAIKLWQRFFYCLSKIESLGSGSNFSKTAKTHLGIYQFSSDGNGNIFPCIKLWNDRHRQCRILEKADDEYYKKILLRDDQKFNLFCGVNKIVQNFYVQVNRGKSCVSLHSEAYQHFGPLLNTVGDNLEKLMVCVAK